MGTHHVFAFACPFDCNSSVAKGVPISNVAHAAPGPTAACWPPAAVQHINRSYRRTGSLWEGRFRSAIVHSDTYLFACHRYIELNPVRAEMVSHPADYPWSSFKANAMGADSTLLSPHPLYIQLGNDPTARQTAYRELFRNDVEKSVIDRIRAATNGGFVLGDRRFEKEIAAHLKRRVTPGKRGRPPKQPPDERQVSLTID